MIDELKDSLGQTTAWLVLVVSAVAKMLPEIEAAGYGTLDAVWAAIQDVRGTAETLGVTLSMLWIGLPAKFRGFIQS